ncbi:MAG: hypothetical protein ACK52U_03770, partial [Synechococcaceae cyanobacterium]
EETVALTLVEGAGYRIGTTAAVVGSIADEDPLITLSLAPTAVSENGSTNLTYIFSRSGSTSTALTVQYSVAGSASLGSDYSGLAASPAIKSLTIAAGSASASVTVDPNADSESEADETVALSLVAGAGYRIGSTAAVVGTILNGDGYIPGPTTINGVNLGSTSLGYGLRNGGGAPIQITFPGGNASASNPGSGWGATAISGSATGYNLYWRNSNSNSGEVVIWQLNSGGAYTSGSLLSPSQLLSEEASLNLDLNGDGYTSGSRTIDGVNLGSTSLGYALRSGGSAAIQVTYSGINASESSPGNGWRTLAATSSGGGYKLFWRNGNTREAVRWELNGSGAYQSGAQLTASQLISEETVVNADLNGDSIIGGNFTTLESNGNATLLRKSDGLAVVRVGTDQFSVTSPFGLGTGNASSTWQILAAEKVGNQNQILWRNNPGTFLHVWTLDASWHWQSSSANVAPSSAAALGLETNFQLDLNGNGVIG